MGSSWHGMHTGSPFPKHSPYKAHRHSSDKQWLGSCRAYRTTAVQEIGRCTQTEWVSECTQDIHGYSVKGFESIAQLDSSCLEVPYSCVHMQNSLHNYNLALTYLMTMCQHIVNNMECLFPECQSLLRKCVEATPPNRTKHCPRDWTTVESTDVPKVTYHNQRYTTNAHVMWTNRWCCKYYRSHSVTESVQASIKAASKSHKT